MYDKWQGNLDQRKYNCWTYLSLISKNGSDNQSKINKHLSNIFDKLIFINPYKFCEKKQSKMHANHEMRAIETPYVPFFEGTIVLAEIQFWKK